MSSLAARCGALQASADSLKGDVNRNSTATERAQKEMAKAFEGQLATLDEKVHLELGKKLGKSEGDIQPQLTASLEAVHASHLALENVFTRAIAWQLRGFKRRLASLLQAAPEQRQECCITSPGFSLCSLPEMKLQVEVAARSGDAQLNVAVPLPGAPVPVPGSCAICLWAAPGIHLSFRLNLGVGPTSVSRRFEHTFSAGAPGTQLEGSESLVDGCVCFRTNNFCQLDQVWVRETDSIHVGFELLEFRLEKQIEKPVEDIVADDQGSGGESTKDGEDKVDGADDLGVAEDATASDPDPPREESTTLKATPSDNITYIRLLTAEAVMQERVHRELQAFRSRSVRRVEWRLEGCARILDISKAAEAIESPVFSAAGLERIQFHFYPKGHDGSDTGQPPCALYISGPSRAMLKGQLSVGSISRQLEHRFNRRGDFGGRSRFCILQNQLDCDDAIVLALEIAEVEVDLPEVGHSLCLREAAAPRNNGLRSGGSGPNTGAGILSPAIGAKGSLRMKREDPAKTEEFVRCVSLPSLNARQLHRSGHSRSGA